MKLSGKADVREIAVDRLCEDLYLSEMHDLPCVAEIIENGTTVRYIFEFIKQERHARVSTQENNAKATGEGERPSCSRPFG